MSPAACWRPTGRRKTKSHEGGSAHWLQKVRFPGWYGPSVDRRGGIYPARGRLRRRRVRDDASIVPYRGLRHGKVAVSRLGTGLPSIVGAGFIPPAGVCAAAGVRRDEGIPPYGRPGGCSRPVWRWFRKVCRGGIYPSRGPSAAAGFPGRCEHRPLHGFAVRKVAVSRLAVYSTVDRRGGFHIRPRAFAPPRGAAG